MNVLVVNCGSSSVRLDLVVEPARGATRLGARAERLGTPEARGGLEGRAPEALGAASAGEALAQLLDALLSAAAAPPDAVAHRVVHGGERFVAAALVDAAVERAIEDLASQAPLHNPVNLAGIRAARRRLPELPHVAVFDTAFHATLPARARTYALPQEWNQRHGLRRFGFHGTSHRFVSERAAEYLGEPLRALRLVSCHLGNGASVAAVEWGRSVETSMGFTPLEGLVMGTRSGDLDPGVLLTLLRSEGLDADALDEALNERSGLLGLCGAADMRDVEAAAASGDERARLALRVFCHRVRKYVGAYAAVMGGVDAVLLTGGIGEHSAGVRHRVTQRLEFLGARLDEARNREAAVGPERPVAEISAPGSRVRLLVVETDEALAMAGEVRRCLAEPLPLEPAPIPVAVSARHVHLTDAAVERLFGPGSALTPERPLSQPGQFAAAERVHLVGPRGRIESVRVVGPTRAETQVEISRTDEYALGVDAPVRCSGDLVGTPGLVLEGPADRLVLERGVICAQRHIHMTPADAGRYGVEHRDLVEVALDGPGRDLIFGDVVVRVSPSYALEMHVDTDEANAAELVGGQGGVLVPSAARARLRSRGS